jgi:hypothetical protein
MGIRRNMNLHGQGSHQSRWKAGDIGAKQRAKERGTYNPHVSDAKRLEQLELTRIFPRRDVSLREEVSSAYFTAKRISADPKVYLAKADSNQTTILRVEYHLDSKAAPFEVTYRDCPFDARGYTALLVPDSFPFPWGVDSFKARMELADINRLFDQLRDFWQDHR